MRLWRARKITEKLQSHYDANNNPIAQLNSSEQAGEAGLCVTVSQELVETSLQLSRSAALPCMGLQVAERILTCCHIPCILSTLPTSNSVLDRLQHVPAGSVMFLLKPTGRFPVGCQDLKYCSHPGSIAADNVSACMRGTPHPHLCHHKHVSVHLSCVCP
jgi:hypothetical protein